MLKVQSVSWKLTQDWPFCQKKKNIKLEPPASHESSTDALIKVEIPDQTVRLLIFPEAEDLKSVMSLQACERWIYSTENPHFSLWYSQICSTIRCKNNASMMFKWSKCYCFYLHTQETETQMFLSGKQKSCLHAYLISSNSWGKHLSI